MGLEAWVERPLSVAAELSRGACGGHYMDACLMVSGLISGIASFVWPGTHGDRRRFIEAWVQFSAPDGDARHVSVPLLRRWLLDHDQVDMARALEQACPPLFNAGQRARVIHGDELDCDENALLTKCPSLDVATMRRHSYATVFYEDVRCKLVHEGELSGTAASFPMTIKKDPRISYVNRTVATLNVDGEVAKVTGPERDRRIFFHMEFLADVTRNMARNVDTALANGPIPQPKRWWIDGPTRPTTMTTDEVRAAIDKAMRRLIDDDGEILGRDVNERTLTHRLAVYLEQDSLFKGWYVDCEYNRDGTNPKRLNQPTPISSDDTKGRTIFPDIIIHKRVPFTRCNEAQKHEVNAVVIEAKKDADDAGEREDLAKLTEIKADFLYRFAVFVNFHINADAAPRWCIRFV
ncbi:MAG: hypothetical protein ACLP1X_07150 [Polyangiaceae bacterium]